MKIISSILIVVIIIMSLALGGVGGFLLSKDMLKGPTAVEKVINSKLVPSIMAIGQVSSISGRNIILSYEGESLEIFVREDARIISVKPEGTTPTEQSTIGVLKVGDNVSLTIKVLSDGKVEASTVVISSPTGTGSNVNS